jgi:carbon monoxide dehydrogenase subunit G
MEVCPTELIVAPPERIWHLLTDPLELARWSGTKLVEGPERPVRAGDRLVLRAGIMHIVFDVVTSSLRGNSLLAVA